jgi:hypothetical protein
MSLAALSVLRQRLKYFAPAYAAYRFLMALKSDSRSKVESAFYAWAANRKHFVYSESFVEDMLRGRLGSRSIFPMPKKRLNIFAALRHVNWEDFALIPALQEFGTVTVFDWGKKGFDEQASDWVRKGRVELNHELLKAVRRTHQAQPIDLFFGYLNNWQVQADTIAAIADLGVVTVNMCLDDKYLFWGRHAQGIWSGLAPLMRVFDLHCTNTLDGPPKYYDRGGIPYFWPEGANPEVHKPYDVPRDIPVSFIGRRYGYRPILIDRLRKAGIPVQTLGIDWEAGEIPVDEMVRTYSRSQINLGIGGVQYSSQITCIKGRDFEIPMSGGFYLTQYSLDLESCYRIGQEIACYRNEADLIAKIRYFLAHPDEVEQVRIAGRARALRDHTWEKRFRDLSYLIGFSGYGGSGSGIGLDNEIHHGARVSSASSSDQQ